MKDIFVTATNTDVGKTYTTLRLIEKLHEQGLRPGVFKPVETGVTEIPADAALLLEKVQHYNSDFQRFGLQDICPVQFSLPAAPFVAAQGETIDLAPVFAKYQLLKQACDILLIEGAGGLLVPLRRDYFMYHLIRDFNAVTLLVTHDRLGCINDTLLNLAFAKTVNLNLTWCVNLRERKHFSTVTLPFYKAAFDKVLTLQDDLDALTQLLIKKVNQ